MAKPQEGAIGIPIAATVRNSDGSARDISNATIHDFIFRKPDGSCMTRAAMFLNDGSDGILVYNTEAGDLTPAGFWRLQADLVQPGYEGLSSVGSFWVLRNLCAE